MLICLTASHKNAGFDMLERLSASSEQAAPRLLDGHPTVQGAVVVATCNRFEAYLDLDTPDGESPVEAVHDALRPGGWFAFFEFLFFIGILVLAYVYVWRKGALEWE